MTAYAKNGVSKVEKPSLYLESPVPKMIRTVLPKAAKLQKWIN
jgi:hypothetical protein